MDMTSFATYLASRQVVLHPRSSDDDMAVDDDVVKVVAQRSVVYNSLSVLPDEKNQIPPNFFQKKPL